MINGKNFRKANKKYTVQECDARIDAKGTSARSKKLLTQIH